MKNHVCYAFYKSIFFLSFLLFSQLAFAVDISGATTASVATSTINNGAPGDIHITSSGSITLKDTAGTNAVVIDSDNALNNEGSISIDNADNSNGIFVQGNRNASIYSNGSILVSEDYVRTDTNKDGQPDGPFAMGTSRNGIFIQGPGTFTGDVNLDNASAISVQGNDSAGVKITSLLQGALVNDGSISVTGDNALGIDASGGATGTVLQSGTVFAQGLNAIGIHSTGQVNGPFINDGSTISTGFGSTTLSNYSDPATLKSTDIPIDQRISADNLLVGGPAVSIGGSLNQGLLNNGAVGQYAIDTGATGSNAGTITNYDADRTPGAISTYGSAPALQITPYTGTGGVGDLVIGNVVEPVRDITDANGNGNTTETIATFNYDYGIINRGTISSNGLNVGFESTGVLIKGTGDGSRKVVINGGLLNAGGITANAYEANATALSVGPYTVLNRITNGGNIEADVTTDTSHLATAVSIGNNSIVNEIVNTGTIKANATTTGATGSAAAIVDTSGTLASVINHGTISAGLTINDQVNFVSGSKIAIDASGNDAAHPITILQSQLTPTKDTNGDGVIDINDVPTPSLTGDILMGAGNDTLDIQAGTVTGGSVDFGAGIDNLSVSNGSSFSAAVSNVENVVIDNSTATFNILAPITIDQLQVKGNSQFTINTSLASENLTAPRITVNGNASFDSSSTIKIQLENFVNKQFELNLIKAGNLNLNYSDPSSNIIIESSAIYKPSLVVDATSLQVLLVPITAQDLGLTGNESSSFNSFLNYAEENNTVGTALTSYSDLKSLADDYTQLLPDYSDANAKMVASELSLATGPVGARLETLNEVGAGVWSDVSIFGSDQNRNATGVGYSTFGVSMQLGIDFPLFNNFISGIGLALRDVRNDPNKSTFQEVHSTAYDASLYFSYAFHNLSLSAAGFAGLIENYSDRNVNFGGISDEYLGKWHGHYFAGSSKLEYKLSLHKYFIAPAVTVDYFNLSQNGYSETTSNAANPLALSVGRAHTRNLSGTFLLNLGTDTGFVKAADCESNNGYGGSGALKEVYIGYQTELNSSPYSTNVNFVNATGAPFGITDLNGKRKAIVYGARIQRSSGCNMSYYLGYGGEKAGDYMVNKAYAEIRIAF